VKDKHSRIVVQPRLSHGLIHIGIMIVQIPLTQFGVAKAPEGEVTLEKIGLEDGAFGIASATPSENISSGVSLALSPQQQLDNNMNKPLPNNNDTRANARVTITLVRLNRSQT